MFAYGEVRMEDDLCEICWANREEPEGMVMVDVYIVNIHFVELRWNRKARENKNYQPKEAVF